jgi:CBS domain-containing membrane protein
MVLGQLVAAFMGVTAYKVFGGNVGVAAGMAVGSTTVIMQAAGCIHPPAGATALIAVLGPAQVHHLSYLYVLTPVLVSTVIIIVVGLALLNLNPDQSRQYPTSWW